MGIKGSSRFCSYILTIYMREKFRTLLLPKSVTTRQAHRFQAGQSIAYTEDGTPDVPRGGFEIIGLSDPGTHEPGS
jgi:hypothetical protein